MEKHNLNFAFFGTPDVAAETLEILKQNAYLPSFIITSPDKPRGRKMLMTPPPVKVWALGNNIPYIQPGKLDQKEIQKFMRTKLDFFLVVAYGKIIPEEILNMPKLGSINIHYSLLPKYRGASPVETAILNGETETGVTIQKMVYKMDAGPILAQEKLSIYPDEKAPGLRKRLIKIGAELLIKSLPDFAESKIRQISQDENYATFCRKIKKENGLIDLNDDPVKNFKKFRAYAAWPRTFFFKDRKRIIITKARFENEKFIIEKIIPEGGKEIDYHG